MKKDAKKPDSWNYADMIIFLLYVQNGIIRRLLISTKKLGQWPNTKSLLSPGLPPSSQSPSILQLGSLSVFPLPLTLWGYACRLCRNLSTLASCPGPIVALWTVARGLRRKKAGRHSGKVTAQLYWSSTHLKDSIGLLKSSTKHCSRICSKRTRQAGSLWQTIWEGLWQDWPQGHCSTHYNLLGTKWAA